MSLVLQDKCKFLKSFVLCNVSRVNKLKLQSEAMLVSISNSEEPDQTAP